MKKERASSIPARVSKLYLQDLEDIRRILQKKLNIRLSLPATYNFVRPNLLPIFNEIKNKKRRDII